MKRAFRIAFLLLLPGVAAFAQERKTQGMLLLGVRDGSAGEQYRTLLISTDESYPVRSIPGLLVPRTRGFMRVDTLNGLLRASRLGASPREYGSAAPDPCCFLNREILFVDPKYLSLRYSYECTCPGERTAWSTSLRTLSLDALSAENHEVGLPIAEVLGPAGRQATRLARAALRDSFCSKGDAYRTWAIARVSMAEMDNAEGERFRWRVVAIPNETRPHACYGSGEFDVPDLPDTGPLALRLPSAEVSAVKQAAHFRDASSVVDIVVAPSGDLAAVVGYFDLALVRKSGSSWSRLRLFPWQGSPTVVMSEWAFGANVRRWWTELSREGEK